MLCVGAFLCLMSCKKIAFKDSKKIESEMWSATKPVLFDFSIKDISKPYSVIVSVANNDDYRYSNLYLFVDIYMPNKKVVRDTVDFILANEQGKWSGSGLFAPFMSEYQYKKNILFPVAGKYRIALEQAMRCDNGILDGIAEVGVSVEQ